MAGWCQRQPQVVRSWWQLSKAVGAATAGNSGRDFGVVRAADDGITARLPKLDGHAINTGFIPLAQTIVVYIPPDEIADGVARKEAKVNGEIGREAGGRTRTK